MRRRLLRIEIGVYELELAFSTFKKFNVYIYTNFIRAVRNKSSLAYQDSKHFGITNIDYTV